MTVGFIGLGAMGLPMAHNVAEAGHTLRIMRHRRAEPVRALESRGAVVCRSVAEVADGADAVITVLPADEELSSVLDGSDGLAARMQAGQALIDMTTAKPATLLRFAPTLSDRGVALLDAPVSGGTTAAHDGTLTIIAGTTERELERWRPLLETMGTRIFHVGSPGQGKVFKIVNQLLAAIHLLAIGEAFGLGVKLGADPRNLKDVISASSGYSRMMDLRLDGFLLDGTFEPGFTLDLMKKDIRLAVESAHSARMAAPLASQVHEIYLAASTAGFGALDFSKAAAVLASVEGSPFGASDGARTDTPQA